MKLNFRGKTAVISGASGGIGLKTVDKICLLGIKILMLDIKKPPKKYLQNKNISFVKVDITNFSPVQRKVGMVFHSYALFPHLTVSSNLSLGLQVRGIPKESCALSGNG